MNDIRYYKIYDCEECGWESHASDPPLRAVDVIDGEKQYMLLCPECDNVIETFEGE
jgi:hypothetical protein